MTTWSVTNIHKKSAFEVQYWTKDDMVFSRTEGYRWGEWFCESDEKPELDLVNEDGFEIDSDTWEMQNLNDGCWFDWDFPSDMSEDEIQVIRDAWEDEYYEGLEKLGWQNTDTYFWLYGPLKLVNEDTGEQFSGVPDEPTN